MKRCLKCDQTWESETNPCPRCGYTATIIDGFQAFAPNLAHGGGGFKASYFSNLARLEAKNFWFRARNEIILWALQRYAPHCRSFLEIGCGTGFVLSGIAAKRPEIMLTGSEIFIEGLSFASARVPSASLMQMDARQIPFVSEFDVIGAFDVLEHIKEDELVLDQIRNALKPDGLVIISVPQHQLLWSAIDEHAFHERRYSARELESKVVAAGLKIIRSCSFVTTLLPVMAVARMLPKRGTSKFDPADELAIHPIINALFEKMMIADLLAIKLGINYAVGGSRLLVAQRT